MTLGRVAGIRLGAHWSVVAIWWLLTWSLSTQLLPDAAPGYSRAAYWWTGSGAAVALLGCLLAHELSHALVARQHGVATEGITLWAVGGVAQLRDESPTPRAELLIATAGPAASVGIAVAAGALWGSFGALGAPDLLVAAIGWLALVNVVLAVFNLLPGFPLDGGRVLHAYLWWRGGDRAGATRTAAKVGRGLGYGLIAIGLLEFTAGLWTGLWLAFIGWFLVTAAAAEGTFSTLRTALQSVTVGDVMSRDPDLAPDWISVQELLEDHVMRLRHSSFPVQDRAGRLTGLVTLTAVKSVPPADRLTTSVAAVATPRADVGTAVSNEPLMDLLGRLSSTRDRRVLVFDTPGSAGQLVGIVTPTDVARALEYAALADA